jgi:HPt (histidine-containing phosphotransfer) domain-containing protein
VLSLRCCYFPVTHFSFLPRSTLVFLHRWGYLQNPLDQPYERVMRAAHLVKGSAANLMCGQLRSSSMALETAARECAGAGGADAPAPTRLAVETAFGEFSVACQNFESFVQALESQ